MVYIERDLHKDSTSTDNIVCSSDTTCSYYYSSYTSVSNTDEHIDYTALKYELYIERKKMFEIFKYLFLVNLKIAILLPYIMVTFTYRKTVRSTTPIRRYKQSKRK